MSLKCLRFASESGASIIERPIHTSNEECREYLLAAGAVDYSPILDGVRPRHFRALRPSRFNVAIYRGDLEAMKRIRETTAYPIGDIHFQLASRVDPEICLALAQWCDREVLYTNSYSIVQQTKVDGLKLLVASGIDKEIIANIAPIGGPESLRYLYSLGVSYIGRDLNNVLSSIDLPTMKTLTEIGYMWTPESLKLFAAMEKVEKLKYLLEIVEYPTALFIQDMSVRAAEEWVFKTFHLAGYPAAQRGALPPRTENICKAVIDYIREKIDPDY